jgi:uncharacterized protein YegP (UPF0339 family)
MPARWVLLVCALLTAVFALPSTLVQAQERSGLKFEIYRDAKAQFRWRLKAANGAVLATGGESYKAKADCERGVKIVQQAGAPGSKSAFETYEDAGKQFRWRLKARNGRVIAESSEAYKAKVDCERAIEQIKKAAANAPVEEAAP